MKKIAMTICTVAFISMMSYAQGTDSTNIRNGTTGTNEIGTQDRNLNQSTDPQPTQGIQQDSIQSFPPTQDQTSPTQQQSQPPLQSQPQLQTQPELQSQPLQTQPQVPLQSQPDPNRPAQQNQLNQSTQPSSPTSTEPTGAGTRPRR